MFELKNFGIPEEERQLMENFFTDPMIELSVIVQQSLKDVGRQVTLSTHKENPLIKEALGYLAFKGDLYTLNNLLYFIEKEDTKKIHFDWKIPNQKIPLTFSNQYFAVFYDQLYKYNILGTNEKILLRGAILRALCQVTFIPWKTFFLPVTERMIKDFDGMPLLDSGRLHRMKFISSS